MTVIELIEKLKTFPKDLDILIYFGGYSYRIDEINYYIYHGGKNKMVEIYPAELPLTSKKLKKMAGAKR